MRAASGSSHMGRCLHRVINRQRFWRIFQFCKSHESFAKTETTDNLCSNGNHENSNVPNPFSWLGARLPCFGLSGKQILVLNKPSEFYETLKERTCKAKQRVIIASLYLGNGAYEKELVNSIYKACQHALYQENEEFEVNILLDYTRGLRGVRNSVTMLLPVLKNFPHYMHLSLYHTPDLRGILKKLIPERFNETIGLTHIKAYVFDNSFIISGANLSESYFTNRQDRYVLVNDCKGLSDFFTSLVKTVSSFSFQVTPDATVHFSKDFKIHPYEDSDDGSRFKRKAREKILELLRCTAWENQDAHVAAADTDTWLYPLVQMGPMDVQDDEQITKQLLRRTAACDQIFLASGYFNLTDHYMNIILQESFARFKILMASPQVNGFFGAKGIAGAIPHLYTNVAKHFYAALCHHCQQERIQLYEYYRSRWTFHVKGLWYYVSAGKYPNLTLIGSSNFGYRSVNRDLECQLAMVTVNTKLQQQLQQEHIQLFQKAQKVGRETFQHPKRYIPLWVRLVTRLIKDFF